MTDFKMTKYRPASSTIGSGRLKTDVTMRSASTVWELPVPLYTCAPEDQPSEYKLWRRLCFGAANLPHLAYRAHYDVLYLCRRWEDNSDAALDVVKMNGHNTYKDRIRTWELQARIALNAHSPK